MEEMMMVKLETYHYFTNEGTEIFLVYTYHLK